MSEVEKEKATFDTEFGKFHAEFEKSLDSKFYSLKVYTENFYDNFSDKLFYKMKLLLFVVIAAVVTFMTIGMWLFWYPMVYVPINTTPDSPLQFFTSVLGLSSVYGGLEALITVSLFNYSKRDSEAKTKKNENKIPHVAGSEVMADASIKIILALWFGYSIIFLITGGIAQRSGASLNQIVILSATSILIMGVVKWKEKKVTPLGKILHCIAFLYNTEFEHDVSPCVKILIKSVEEYFSEEQVVIKNKEKLATTLLHKILMFDQSTIDHITDVMKKENLRHFCIIEVVKRGNKYREWTREERLINYNTARKWLYYLLLGLFKPVEELKSNLEEKEDKEEKESFLFEFERNTPFKKILPYKGTIITIITALLALIPTLLGLR